MTATTYPAPAFAPPVRPLLGSPRHSALCRISLALLATSLAACGGDEGSGDSDNPDDHEIAASPLAGTIDGQPFSFLTGEARFIELTGDWFIELYAADFLACDETPRATNLSFSVPTETGDFPAGPTRIINFNVRAGDEDLLFLTGAGRIEVDEITDATIRGGLYALYVDGDNEVSGTFEATICPEFPGF